MELKDKSKLNQKQQLYRVKRDKLVGELIQFIKTHSPKHSFNYSYFSNLTDSDYDKVPLHYLKRLANRIKRDTKARNRIKRQKAKQTIKQSSIDYLDINKPKSFQVEIREGCYLNVNYKNRLGKWAYQYHLEEDNVSRQQMNYNFLKIKTLIRILFSQYSKIYTCRFDFHFEYEDSRDLDKVNYLFKRLQNETVNNHYGYLGYVCIKEFSETDGIHLHCLYLLDGKVHQSSAYFYQMLKNKWLKLGGKSVYNRDYDKHKLPDRGAGIGLIKYTDTEKIFKLVNLCKYFVKDVSHRDWVERLGYKTNRKLLTTGYITEKLAMDKQITLINSVNPNREYPVDYSFIDSISLNKNKSFLELMSEIEKE
nr:MAG TPA: Inovirus Gp2 [Caudoviricetes sp.]